MAILASLAGAACGSGPLSPSALTSASADATLLQRCVAVLWSADIETGDLSQWAIGGGGGEFDSGVATVSASQDAAHSGQWAAKLTIQTPGVSAVRLFRWQESHTHAEACYSAWYYFPQRYSAPDWWNVFQFKSRNGPQVNDPFWFLQVGNRPGGAMDIFLNWWNGLSIEGPQPGQFGGRTYNQSLKDLPVDRWTHIEAYLRQSTGFDGQIAVWQDGVELFDLNNVRTRYAADNGANEWSVDNYSDGVVPSPTTFYVDDAEIRAASP
jgi:hypothetical protein